MTIDKFRKAVFISLILLSFVFYAPLVFDDPDRLAVGRLIGFFGLQLIWWQVILGNRQLTRFITVDLLWTNKLHQLSGTYGFLIILLHPLLMMSAYGLSLVWPVSFEGTFNIGIRFGTLALSLLSFIWLTSALLRGRIGWRWWKRLHYCAYILFPVLFLHMVMAGSSINQYPWLEVWLYTIVTIFWAALLLRIAGLAGTSKIRYRLIEAKEVARDVTRFRLQPVKSGIFPKPGQFAYLQAERFGEAHPFTISLYDASMNEISFSIKAVGPYSRRLRKLKPGATVFIDGPYGVFTQGLTQANRPVVVIAGGIGITPFIRHIQERNIDHLFWGCKTESDIAYRDMIETSGIPTHYVLSEENKRKAGHETGTLSVALIKKTLDQPLPEYDFYICGPAPMMKSLRSQLIDEGVSHQQIFQEKFSL